MTKIMDDSRSLRGIEQAASPPSMTSDEIVARLQQIVPPGSGCPLDAEVRYELSRLTAQLIECRARDGRLGSDPFEDARDRRIHCYEDEVRGLLRGKVVLVTGGAGCVGSAMLAALPRFEPRRIVCVDKAPADPAGAAPCHADIRDSEALQEIFRRERPQVVFHLAAQRDPGLAERRVHETITTNVFGTANLIQACEESGVEVCVFSSTGKASRYLTHEVYAASKKLAEWQFSAANRSGCTRYVMTRFTHILDNSLVCEQLDRSISAGQPIGVHAPGRLVVAQNLQEAVQLLLNSSTFAKAGRLRLLVARNLGWPVETLELALYRIRQSGRDVPIYFLGVPAGYREDFFRGQADWRFQMDLHTLLNVLESPARKFDPAGQMIYTELESFDENTLHRHLLHLREAFAVERTPETEMRGALRAASDELCASVLEAAPPAELLNILHWGVGPKSVGPETVPDSFPPIVRFLAQALRGRVSDEAIRQSVLKATEYEELLEVLAAGDCLPLDLSAGAYPLLGPQRPGGIAHRC